jgi:hypothetical protein
MGTDIYGFLEIRGDNGWEGVLNLNFLPRNYDLFGILFGVRKSFFNHCRFQLGLPPDPSKEFMKEVERFDLDPTLDFRWLFWTEIEKLDIRHDRLFHSNDLIEILRKTESGLVFDCFKPAAALALLTGEEEEELFTTGVKEKGRYLYKTVPHLEEFSLSEDWQKFFDLGKTLSAAHGSDAVRASAHFL